MHATKKKNEDWFIIIINDAMKFLTGQSDQCTSCLEKQQAQTDGILADAS